LIGALFSEKVGHSDSDTYAFNENKNMFLKITKTNNGILKTESKLTIKIYY
jgi:hypothetical protein